MENTQEKNEFLDIKDPRTTIGLYHIIFILIYIICFIIFFKLTFLIYKNP